MLASVLFLGASVAGVSGANFFASTISAPPITWHGDEIASAWILATDQRSKAWVQVGWIDNPAIGTAELFTEIKGPGGNALAYYPEYQVRVGQAVEVALTRPEWAGDLWVAWVNLNGWYELAEGHTGFTPDGATYQRYLEVDSNDGTAPDVGPVGWSGTFLAGPGDYTYPADQTEETDL